MSKKNWLIFLLFVFVIAAGLFYQQIFRMPDTLNQTPVSGKTENKTKVTPEKSSTLDLSRQNLEKLPPFVLKRTDLEELNISNNNFTGALPAEIHDLRNLRILNASDNLMTGIPAEVGQLQNLEVLDLSNNRLTGLPYELGNLKKLKRLDLSGNNYSKQDLEVIKKGLPPQVEIIL